MNPIITAPELGQRTEQLGVAVTQRTGELAVAAMAAKAKAQVEARYVIAYNRPRSILQARSDILAACQRPGFAESARYKKPIGDTTIDGFSIRFAEEAIKAMKNINVESTTIYEDDDKRTVQISVTDLENNLTYGKEVTVAKTVERQHLKKDQVPISSRLNSLGKMVYLVKATEDEISNKIASAESKIIRNCGLRLIPSDILEEAEDAIASTLASGGTDVNAATKKLTDAFASLNISPVELEKYLKHTLATVSPKELQDLRAIYSAVKDGEASWSDYLGDAPAKTKPTLPAKKPSTDDGDLGPVTPPAELPAVAPVETAAPLGPQDQLAEKLKTVPFAQFLAWDANKDRVPAEEKADAANYHDLSDETCQKLLADTKAIRNVTLLHGTKPA